MNDDILKIPFVDIKRIIKIRNEKRNAVERQSYREAEILRDKEKYMVTKYPCLLDINSDELIGYLRDGRIDSLLDVNLF